MIRRAAASPGTLLFFALLALTLAVAVVIVRSRTPDLVLEVESIEPRELVVNGGVRPDPAEITFFVRENDSRAAVSIVNPSGEVVRTLASEVALEAHSTVSFEWDGRNDVGQPAMPNRYRLRVVLRERDREMVWPRRITVRRGDRGPGDR